MYHAWQVQFTSFAQLVMPSCIGWGTNAAKITLCNSKKYPYLAHGESKEVPRGEGGG